MNRRGSAPKSAAMDEFVLHMLEKEIKKVLSPDEGNAPSKDLVKKRLQGLGYIE